MAKVRICEWCGHPFGIERGGAAKTCSYECQRDRNNAKEKERYQRVKDTKEWKENRAQYLERIKQKAMTDAEFAISWRMQQRLATRRYIQKNPRTPEDQQAKRLERRAWRKWLMSDPMAWEAHKFKSRRWYSGLSAEDKKRIYGFTPRTDK